jgi:hypothetical protein
MWESNLLYHWQLMSLTGQFNWNWVQHILVYIRTTIFSLFCRVM